MLLLSPSPPLPSFLPPVCLNRPPCLPWLRAGRLARGLPRELRWHWPSRVWERSLRGNFLADCRLLSNHLLRHRRGAEVSDECSQCLRRRTAGGLAATQTIMPSRTGQPAAEAHSPDVLCGHANQVGQPLGFWPVRLVEPDLNCNGRPARFRSELMDGAGWAPAS